MIEHAHRAREEDSSRAPRMEFMQLESYKSHASHNGRRQGPTIALEVF